MKLTLNANIMSLKYNETSTTQTIKLDLGLKDLVIAYSSCGSEKTLNAKEPIIDEPFVLLSKYELDNLLSKISSLSKTLNEINTLSK